MNKSITKSELTWWKGMLLMIIGVVIWAIRLESKVIAMQSKGEKLREEYEISIVEMKNDIRIIKNIQIEFAKEFNIKIKY